MQTAHAIQPLRLSMKTAAVKLGLTSEGVRGLVQAGVLNPLTPNGRGRGKRMYLLPAEVEAYALGGLEGVVEYRKNLKRKAGKAK